MSLKKCPLCGKKRAQATENENPNGDMEYHVSCGNCGLSTADYKSILLASEAWNTRDSFFNIIKGFQLSRRWLALLLINIGIKLIPSEYRNERLIHNMINTRHIKV